MAGIGEYRSYRQRKSPVWQHAHQPTGTQTCESMEHWDEDQPQAVTGRFHQEMAIVCN